LHNKRLLKTVKTTFIALTLLILISLSARAGVFFTFSGTPADNGAGPGVIPDNSTIGLAESQIVSGLNTSISSVLLSVTLQGGAATDLSGYLRLGNLAGSPAFNLSSSAQSQDLSSGSAVTFNVDATSAFSAANPNNTWTLFYADGVNGDQTTLNGWSLEITAVPEPINVALGIFGGAMGMIVLARSPPVKLWREKILKL
jgi:hypothetical protein